MANFKTGFEYWSIQTDRYQDLKLKRLKKKYKTAAIAIWDYITNDIYRDKGYYIVVNSHYIYDVAEYWNMEEDEIKEIIDFCCEVGMWSKPVYKEFQTLTSPAIQERFLSMSKQSKRLHYSIKDELYLLGKETLDNPDALPKKRIGRKLKKEKQLQVFKQLFPLAENYNGLPKLFNYEPLEMQIHSLQQIRVSKETFGELWEVFKKKFLDGKNPYSNEDDIYKHYGNWVVKLNFDPNNIKKLTANGKGKTNNGSNTAYSGTSVEDPDDRPS